MSRSPSKRRREFSVHQDGGVEKRVGIDMAGSSTQFLQVPSEQAALPKSSESTGGWRLPKNAFLEASIDPTMQVRARRIPRTDKIGWTKLKIQEGLDYEYVLAELYRRGTDAYGVWQRFGPAAKTVLKGPNGGKTVLEGAIAFTPLVNVDTTGPAETIRTRAEAVLDDVFPNMYEYLVYNSDRMYESMMRAYGQQNTQPSHPGPIVQSATTLDKKYRVWFFYYHPIRVDKELRFNTFQTDRHETLLVNSKAYDMSRINGNKNPHINSSENRPQVIPPGNQIEPALFPNAPVNQPAPAIQDAPIGQPAPVNQPVMRPMPAIQDAPVIPIANMPAQEDVSDPEIEEIPNNEAQVQPARQRMFQPARREADPVVDLADSSSDSPPAARQRPVMNQQPAARPVEPVVEQEVEGPQWKDAKVGPTLVYDSDFKWVLVPAENKLYKSIDEANWAALY